MKMEIKDSGLYIDMTHDAREYKRKVLSLNGIELDAMGNEFVDSWVDAVADANETLDDVMPSFDPDCPVCQAIMAEQDGK